MLTADLADAVVDFNRQPAAFDSVNPGLGPGAVDDGPIAQFAADHLSGSGFEVQLVPALFDPRRMSGVPTVARGPAGGGLNAVGEWVDLERLLRYPMAMADAVGRFLGG